MKEVVNLKTVNTKKKSAPALSLEARERQLVAKAFKLAEKQLDDGTASSQIITTLMKAGMVDRQLELERVKLEMEKLKAQTKQIEAAEQNEKIVRDALEAFRMYTGGAKQDEYDEEDLY